MVGGGQAAGKASVGNRLKEILASMSQENDFALDVKIVNLKDYTKEGEGGPSVVDFDGVLDLINKNDEANEALIEKNVRGPGVQPFLVLVVVGNYALYDERIRDRAVMKVFVHTDPDARLSQWILRDANDDKDLLPGILDEYLSKARPEFQQYISPTRQYADVVTPRGCEETAVHAVATGVFFRLREELVDDSADGFSNGLANSGISSVASLLDTDSSRSQFDIRRESFTGNAGQFYELS